MPHITRTERVQAFLFLVIGLCVTAGVVVTLVGLPFGVEHRVYFLRFTQSVIGLDEGTPVRYMGKKYGKIGAIDVDPQRPEEIVVRLEVDLDCPIKASTTARIASGSILGNYYVELLGSRGQSPDLPPFSEIPAETSTLSRLLKAGETVGDELVTVLSNLESWTTTERRDAFFGAVDDLRGTIRSAKDGLDRAAPAAEEALHAWRDLGLTLNSVVVENRETGERLLRDLAVSAERVRTFVSAGELEELSSTTRRTLETLAQELKDAGTALRAWLERNDLAPHLKEALASLDRMVADFRRLAEAVETESVGLAHDLGPAIRDLRTAAEAFTRAVESLSRNPRALLFGAPPPEKRLPGEGDRR